MIKVLPEVDDAIRSQRPVVALETAVVTAGLPTNPSPTPLPIVPAGFDPSGPINLEVARGLEREVRGAGAIPATIGVIDGTLHIGMEGHELERLARASGEKVSSAGLAAAMSVGRTAGTTVSATVAACRVLETQFMVMATGGIGGVHRGWTRRPDLSADLAELARGRVCVVCAGAKTVLDVAATYELLEALGVPLLAFGADTLPAFLSRTTSPPLPATRVDRVSTIGTICRHHWFDLDGGGVVVAQPVDEEVALDTSEIDAIIEQEDRVARSLGADRTPLVLERLVERTRGRSLAANVALLSANVGLAARIASELHGHGASDTRT